MNLENIQSLLALIDQFKTIKRTILNVGQEVRENDAEHSYELAMLCWFLAAGINREQSESLNLERVFKYALAHDLVEAYAGDTNTFNKDEVSTKHEREHAAFEKIKIEFIFFPDMVEAIEHYELQNDSESVFVKSVDKIVPILANLREYGKSWKKFNQYLTLDELSEIKESKIKNDHVLKIWDSIKKEIQAKGYLK